MLSRRASTPATACWRKDPHRDDLAGAAILDCLADAKVSHSELKVDSLVYAWWLLRDAAGMDISDFERGPADGQLEYG